MQGWVRILALRRVDEQAVLSRGIIEIVEQFDSKVRLGKVRLWFPNVILLILVTRTMGSNYSFWVCSLNSSGIQTAYDSDTFKRTTTLASSPNWSWMTSWPSGWVAKSFWFSVQFRFDVGATSTSTTTRPTPTPTTVAWRPFCRRSFGNSSIIHRNRAKTQNKDLRVSRVHKVH